MTASLPGSGFFMAQPVARLDNIQKETYSRNILVSEIGEAGQLRLAESRVLLVGLGGLGSSALCYLAAAGVGEIGIADGDRVDRTNLQRQILHGPADIGRPKTESARESVLKLRTDLRLNLHPFRLTPENAARTIAPYDFVIDATDNFDAKFLINDVCVGQGKAFCHAAAVGLHGQAMTIVPGKGPCYRCVFQEKPPAETVESADRVGVLGCVPGALGIIQAAEAIKYLVGCGDLLVGRLLTWDLRTMAFREIGLPLSKRCKACDSNRHSRPER